MIAALTLAVLYAISVIIVRFSAVTLRHTGLSDNVARLQSISAISGTGFTTSEAEKILNHPVRRRVITWLMIIGNLGLASVAATLIVTFVGKDGDPVRIALQALLILAAVAVMVVATNNGALDRWMCGLIAKIVAPSIQASDEAFERLLLLDDERMIARHTFTTHEGKKLKDIWPDAAVLIGLTVRLSPMDKPEPFSPHITLSKHTEILCFGNRDAHYALQSLNDPKSA